MSSMILVVLVDLFCLMMLGALGVLAVRFLAPAANRVETAAVCFPLGVGLLTYSVFLLSWSGVEIRLTSVAVTYGCLALLLAGGWWLRSRRDERKEESNTELGRATSPRWSSWALWVMLGVVAVVSMVIAVGRSYTPFDASAVWAPKGYGIALKGTVFAGRDWGGGGLIYPLNLPLLISIFQLADGDALPGAKLAFPLFFMSVLIGTVAFWRRLRVPHWWVLAGILVLATIPEIFRHSTYGYLNLPGAAYLVLGTMWGALGVTRGSRGHTAVGGLLLGLASWTRVEGLLHALVAIGAIWLMLRPAKFHILWLVGPVAILGGAWLGFAEANGFAGGQPGGSLTAAIQAWTHGDLNLHALRLILGFFRRELFDLRTWGFLFPLAIAALVLYARRLTDRSVPEIPVVALATLGMGVATVGLFYVGSYARSDLIGWLTRTFPRAFFHVAFLLAILSFTVASSGKRLHSGED